MTIIGELNLKTKKNSINYFFYRKKVEVIYLKKLKYKKKNIYNYNNILRANIGINL